MKYKILSIILMHFLFSVQGQNTSKTFLFVGTYTEGKPGKGIYIYRFDSTTGRLKKVFTGKNITNPSFITLSPDGKYVYACTDTRLKTEGSVSAFMFDSIHGSLKNLNKQVSGGVNPVYLTASRNNEFVVNANYTDGTVSVFKTFPDGSLQPFSQLIRLNGKGPNHRRQEQAHIHAAVFSPDFEYVYFPDLGADKIRVFKFNPKETLPLKPIANFDYTASPGSGPRHFTFHPNNHFAYCIEELSGTITAFKYQNGKLETLQRIFSYSKMQEEYNSADIHVSPDGSFLYASNRWDNENTISIFSIDKDNGKLTLVGHQPTYGDHPRNFTFDPTGNFLLVANQVTNNIIVFKRDLKTGLLTKNGKGVRVANPSCLQMRKYGS